MSSSPGTEEQASVHLVDEPFGVGISNSWTLKLTFVVH